jgi:hypothetical protein
MNNISFQGRTHLALNPQKYSEIVNKTKTRALNPQTNCKLSNCKVFTLNSDVDNLAVIVHGERDGFTKFVPTSISGNNAIKDIMLKTGELLKTSKENLTAWIIGGDKINGKLGNGTVEALNKIADILCDKPNIDASILVGFKKPETVIVHPLLDKIELTMNKPKETDLENIFDIVELNNTKII